MLCVQQGARVLLRHTKTTAVLRWFLYYSCARYFPASSSSRGYTPGVPARKGCFSSKVNACPGAVPVTAPASWRITVLAA